MAGGCVFLAGAKRDDAASPACVILRCPKRMMPRTSMAASRSSKRSTISVDTDKTRLDVKLIHGFLINSYWARGIPLEIVERSIENSLCFGLYDDGAQVGFARVVTDYATFAYLADVFVVE